MRSTRRSKRRRALRRGRHLALLCRCGFGRVNIPAPFAGEHTVPRRQPQKILQG